MLKEPNTRGWIARLLQSMLLIIIGVILLPAYATAATLIVGPGQTYTTIAAARAAAASNDTIIIQDGIYNEAFSTETSYFPNGTGGMYTVIRAANDGGVIVTGEMYIPRVAGHTSQYIQVEGIKFRSSASKEIRGNHIKFLRCAFEGSASTGNTATVGIGTSDYNDTSYILLEDCWAYGLGGRYNISIFNADHIVLRRVVMRHDSGWDDRDKADDPEACIAVYNASEVELQNVIVIDSDRPITTGSTPVAGEYSTWQAGIYIIHNNESHGAGGYVHPTENNYVRGSIAVNITQLCYMEDGSGHTGAEYNDIVCWRSSGGAFSGGSSGGAADAIINRGTFGGSTGTSPSASDGAFSQWDSGSITIANSIITGFARDFHPYANITRSYNALYNNAETNPPCSNCVTVNPQANGLLYLPRIETGTYLTTHGSGNGQIGATVFKRYGVSGTLWGEAGYNTLTNDNLWPWPNEARIKSDFASVETLGGMTGARGFATGTSRDGSPQTLTKYIWEYLGNQIPAEIYGACAYGDIRNARTSVYSATIIQAYNAALENDTVQLHAVEFSGNLQLANAATVHIQGGFTCDYSGNPEYTAIVGTMAISSGPVILDRIILR